MKVTFICTACGSDEVVNRGTLTWNPDKQDYTLNSIDDAWCDQCGSNLIDEVEWHPLYEEITNAQ